MRTLTRTLLILPLLAATLAFAADKPKKAAAFGGGKGTGAFLTKEQLRSCLNRQAAIKEGDDALLKEQAELATVKTDIARAGDELKSKLETIDRTSADAISAYNVAVTARDAQIDAYQKRVDAFNTRFDANHAVHEGLGQDCNSRRYLEEDEIAIKKGK